MGKHMASYVLKQGHEMSVYNRTPEKAQGLVDAGATFREPEDIAKEVDVLFLMLGYP